MREGYGSVEGLTVSFVLVLEFLDGGGWAAAETLLTYASIDRKCTGVAEHMKAGGVTVEPQGSECGLRKGAIASHLTQTSWPKFRRSTMDAPRRQNRQSGHSGRPLDRLFPSPLREHSMERRGGDEPINSN